MKSDNNRGIRVGAFVKRVHHGKWLKFTRMRRLLRVRVGHFHRAGAKYCNFADRNFFPGHSNHVWRQRPIIGHARQSVSWQSGVSRKWQRFSLLYAYRLCKCAREPIRKILGIFFLPRTRAFLPASRLRLTYYQHCTKQRDKKMSSVFLKGSM